MGKTKRERQLLDLLDDQLRRWCDGLEDLPGDASAHLPYILEALGCVDFEPGYLAATAVALLGPAAVETEAMLFGLLDSDDPDLICAALEALIAVRPGSPDRVRFVGRYLLDEEHSLHAAVALNEHAEDIHGELDRVLAMVHSDCCLDRRWAISLLMRPEFSDEESLPTLRLLARDTSGLVSLQAIRGLLKRQGSASETVEALAEVLDSPVPSDRHEAAHLLGRLGTTGAAAASRLAIVAAHDSFEVVREVAGAALDHLRGNTEIPLPGFEASSDAVCKEMMRRFDEFFD